MQNHQSSEIRSGCVVYCFHDRLLLFEISRCFDFYEECTVFSFRNLRCGETAPLTRWVSHTRIPWEDRLFTLITTRTALQRKNWPVFFVPGKRYNERQQPNEVR